MQNNINADNMFDTHYKAAICELQKLNKNLRQFIELSKEYEKLRNKSMSETCDKLSKDLYEFANILPDDMSIKKDFISVAIGYEKIVQGIKDIN